jgi:hypothetical protein
MKTKDSQSPKHFQKISYFVKKKILNFFKEKLRVGIKCTACKHEETVPGGPKLEPFPATFIK